MKTDITNIRLQFHCPTTWDDMEQANNGRYCTQCNKTVYDFTDAKQAEFIQILAECGGNLCARFRAEQMEPLHPVKISRWKKWGSAALVFIGINVFQQQAFAQKARATAKTTQLQPPVSDDTTIGIFIMTSAEFPGGNDAMARYFA